MFGPIFKKILKITLTIYALYCPTMGDNNIRYANKYRPVELKSTQNDAIFIKHCLNHNLTALCYLI